MYSPEKFAAACNECRRLIALQLEAREQLERAIARSPNGPAVAVLRDKVDKLTISTEAQCLKALRSLPDPRS